MSKPYPVWEDRMIDEIKSDMTTSEKRKFEVLARRTSRMWRNFWIEMASNHGWSNMDIARALEISESTVRYVLVNGKDNKQ